MVFRKQRLLSFSPSSPVVIRMAEGADVAATKDPETREVENEVAPEVVYDALTDKER
jgi:hypothetical protein